MDEELLYFNEDAQEQLQMMESALLDAIDQGATTESIGTIFRAMHTIKGVAGMFNFDQIISFTHIAENLMDAARNGDIEVDQELLRLLLECKDHVASLVDCAVNSTDLCEDMLTKDQSLKLQIQNYLDNIGQTPADAAMDDDIEGVIFIDDDEDLTQWHISLKLEPAFFETGMDMLSILSFLQKMGDINSITPIVENIPPIEEIEPAQVYMAFEIDFSSEATKEEIEEVFEFVEDDIELIITEQSVVDDEIEGVIFIDDEDEIVEEPSQQKAVEAPRAVETQKKTTSPKPKAESMQPISASTASQSLRVNSTKIDLIIDTISEMVITNAKIVSLVEEYDNPDLEEASLRFESLLEELRNSVMNIRMIQVGSSFEKFRRVVNDIAHKLGKKITFNIIGGDTELDKTVVEKIADPLIHMLRNSVDHGIEMPDKRKEAGKPEMGTVELRAYPDSGTIVIEIEDDGKGLSPEFILNKAIEKGIVSADAQLEKNEIFQLIFEAGFSTAEQVSDISGRGVGMDVVRKNIAELKGDIELSSEVGKGSKFTIRLPLTLAIIDGFLFQVGNTKYVIPLDMISEVVEYEEAQLVEVLEGNLFDLRGTLLPLINVTELYREIPCTDCERRNVVIAQYAKEKVGLLVDELYGEYQTVIKPLGKLFQHAPGLSGASILGSGEIALILDIPSLFEILNNKGAVNG